MYSIYGIRSMRMSDQGLAFLAGLEGVCLSKYKDSVGVWTIGVGVTRTERNLLAKKFGKFCSIVKRKKVCGVGLKHWPMSKKITINEAFELFRETIQRYENAVNKRLTREIKQHEFDALVSWCYNVGTGWTWKGTLIKAVNRGAPRTVIFKKFTAYKIPPEIIKRRKKEARLFTKGHYSGGGKANVFPVSKRGNPIYAKGYQINALEYIVDADKVEEPQETKKREQALEVVVNSNPQIDDIQTIARYIQEKYNQALDKLKW